MSAPATVPEFLKLVRKSGILSDDALESKVRTLKDPPKDPVHFAERLVRQGVLTTYQAKMLLQGRCRGFKLGPYLLYDQLGQGGMGAVYLADHETLKRKVAIKVLTKPSKGNPHMAIERFLREARAVASLDHVNIVKIYDVVQQGELRYLVMEYVDGESLDKRLEKSGKIPLSQVVDYAIQTACGLQHAHEKGFIHRDIKPANLMLTSEGVVKILDMGLARSTQEDRDKLTEVLDEGAIVGTSDFISPEQAEGSKNIDIRADIYSLGVSLFYLISGTPPFTGTVTQKLMQHQIKKPPELCEVDKTVHPELSAVISKMMAKKPEARFQTPAEVVEALQPWLSVEARAANISASTITHRRMTNTSFVTKPKKARRWVWPLLAGLALILMMIFGGIGYMVIDGLMNPKSAGQPTAITQAEPKTQNTTSVYATPPKQPPQTPPQNKQSQPKQQPKANDSSSTTSTPPTRSAPPAASSKVAYQFPLNELKTFILEMNSRRFTREQKLDVLPKEWLAETLAFGEGLKSSMLTELTISIVDGQNVLSLRSVEPSVRAQLLSDQPLMQMQPNKIYTVVLDYRTEGTTQGLMQFRAVVSGLTKEHGVGQECKIESSKGDWKTIQFELKPVKGPTPLHAFIHAFGSSGQLAIRGFKILERDAK